MVSTSRGSMNSATLHALAAFPQQLEAFYEAMPAAYKHWSRRRGRAYRARRSRRSSRFAMCGISRSRDITSDFGGRLRRTIRHLRPSMDTCSPGIAITPTPMRREALAAFRAARARTIEMISGLTAAQLSRPAMFEGFGPVTVQGLIHILCSHDQQHLAGLQWLLCRIEALPRRNRATIDHFVILHGSLHPRRRAR